MVPGSGMVHWPKESPDRPQQQGGEQKKVCGSSPAPTTCCAVAWYSPLMLAHASYVLSIAASRIRTLLDTRAPILCHVLEIVRRLTGNKWSRRIIAACAVHEGVLVPCRRDDTRRHAPLSARPRTKISAVCPNLTTGELVSCQ